MSIYKINNTKILIRGAGDIASGIAYRLFISGFKVIMTETEHPTSIRRKVCFSEAIYDGEKEIEGVKAIFSKDPEMALLAAEEGKIPVLIDPELKYLTYIKPLALVDAIVAKKNLGTKMEMADIVIGVGPGFEAGKDCHAVIETKRGHNLGKVIYCGSAEDNTGVPGEIMGYAQERVLYAPASGKIKVLKDIGSLVKTGEIVAVIGNVEVKARINGVLRGVIRDGFEVYEGLKIGDVDPTGIVENCYTISDKARAVGGGVLEAILFFMNQIIKN
ncbi:selenium-dependent molybdenum cofactor biosynthesis protein YqeB [Thermovenabulum gondwanense]|uniref:EF2563 family selenium-dependent molybdenum hydroxylase system protein n=1 Tax=Thermovenabulum gondwanense TaxID=520767 RepID=A0A162MNV3_9FIRM|nr:selenium-dependent molybdenum cofactor biosynthesis protein YqeB [Thermovenabulum gondwanense]KYO66817.1 hypothetical protein ATZ99_10620 [Thermovenabulum gondwanense]